MSCPQGACSVVTEITRITDHSSSKPRIELQLSHCIHWNPCLESMLKHILLDPTPQSFCFSLSGVAPRWCWCYRFRDYTSRILLKSVKSWVQILHLLLPNCTALSKLMKISFCFFFSKCGERMNQENVCNQAVSTRKRGPHHVSPLDKLYLKTGDSCLSFWGGLWVDRFG
jgi:hypothetical protein